MKKNKQLSTTRPEKIFLCDRVIRNNSLLDAAIIGDLFYWIAKGKEPWRKAEDYEVLFHVNEKTIRRHFEIISQDLRYLNRSRPRLNNGGFGAYKFHANKTSSSRFLLSTYEGILLNSDIKHDYGDFDPYEPDYREIPDMQLLLVNSIEQTRNISAAYILDRICWALVVRGQDELYFSSKAHFAKWTSFKYKTALRTLDRLRALDIADFEHRGSQLVVWVNECNSLAFFTSYMEEKHEARKMNIIEAA